MKEEETKVPVVPVCPARQLVRRSQGDCAAVLRAVLCVAVCDVVRLAHHRDFLLQMAELRQRRHQWAFQSHQNLMTTLPNHRHYDRNQRALL